MNKLQRGKGLYCHIWGKGTRGKLGCGSSDDVLVPRLLKAGGAEKFCDIALGPDHSAAVDEQGNVWTFGTGSKYQLGFDKSIDRQETPRRVEGLPPVVSVACGTTFTLALTEKGEVYSWGWGGRSAWINWISTIGGLGHGDFEHCLKPRRIEALNGKRIVQIVAGYKHAMALDESGIVYGWGDTEYSVISGTSGRIPEPLLQDLADPDPVEQISTAGSHSFSLHRSGAVRAWGRNQYCQVGTGAGVSLDMYDVVTDPMLLDAFNYEQDPPQQVTCSSRNSIALTESGRVYVWGDNKYPKPEDVSRFFEGEMITSIAAGKRFYLAVSKDKKTFSWGDGGSKCLGHGDTLSEYGATEISDLRGVPVTRVVAGETSAAAFSIS